MNDCCRWELACHSRAVGSLMMHRLQKSLPNPHPSITARHLMSCFFPFIRDPWAQSSHRLPFSESKLLSKCHYNGAIVIIHLTSELGLISFFPVYPSQRSMISLMCTGTADLLHFRFCHFTCASLPLGWGIINWVLFLFWWNFHPL